MTDYDETQRALAEITLRVSERERQLIETACGNARTKFWQLFIILAASLTVIPIAYLTAEWKVGRCTRISGTKEYANLVAQSPRTDL